MYKQMYVNNARKPKKRCTAVFQRYFVKSKPKLISHFRGKIVWFYIILYIMRLILPRTLFTAGGTM